MPSHLLSESSPQRSTPCSAPSRLQPLKCWGSERELAGRQHDCHTYWGGRRRVLLPRRKGDRIPWTERCPGRSCSRALWPQPPESRRSEQWVKLDLQQGPREQSSCPSSGGKQPREPRPATALSLGFLTGNDILWQPGFPGGSDGAESACSARDSEIWVQPLHWEDPFRREWLPIPDFCLENSMGRGAWQAGYSPWAHQESDTIEWLTFSLSVITSVRKRVWKRMNIWICINEAPCCIPETNITLYSNCTPIEVKYKIKNFKNPFK